MLATDEPDDKTSKRTQKPALKSLLENPIDMEKPAVTAATPEDTIVTDETPVAAAKTPADSEPTKHDTAASSVPPPAATIPSGG